MGEEEVVDRLRDIDDEEEEEEEEEEVIASSHT